MTRGEGMAPFKDNTRPLLGRDGNIDSSDTGYTDDEREDDNQPDSSKRDLLTLTPNTSQMQTVTMDPVTVTVSPTTVVVVSTWTAMPTPLMDSVSSRKGLGGPDELAEPDEIEDPDALVDAALLLPATRTVDGPLTGASSIRMAEVSKYIAMYKEQDSERRTAEQILISAASISIFILICLVSWFIYRVVKNRRARPNGEKAGFKNPKAAWLPQSLRRRGWKSLDAHDMDRGVATLPRTGTGTTVSSDMTVQAPAEYFAPTKQEKEMLAIAMTTVHGGCQAQSQHADLLTGGGRTENTYTPDGNTYILDANAYNPNANAFSPDANAYSPQVNTYNPDANDYGPQVPQVNTYSPGTNAYDADGTDDRAYGPEYGTYSYTTTDSSDTVRSRMSDPFYNQSELARQPSDAHDPTRTKVNRASDLSTLSSGFGDGDIVVSGVGIQPPPPSAPNLRQPTSFVGRFSLQSRTTRDRDTIYTSTSEDSPAKFRTINSWVNQQTGRIKRARTRAEEGKEEVPPCPGVPGIPGVPLATGMPEVPQFSMMRDFESPRRPGK